MITENYVSFEVAKLLKEKGFNEEVSRWYVVICPNEGVVPKGFGTDNDYISAPTLQMAMKWLREVHYYSIEMDTLGMMELNNLSWRSSVYYLVNENECYCEHGFDSYEEACESAIKYCLENLI